MFTENSNRRGRGRPAGLSPEGEATKVRIYETAINLIGERGYEAATLREVAARAAISPGLLYRYFPSKRAVVLALYDELSIRFAEQAGELPHGKWRDRFVFTLRLSLEVLWSHRVTLRALVPVIVGDAEDGVFATGTLFARERIQSAFQDAVSGATDAPTKPLADSLGRLLYLLHLGVVLWWLLDRSPEQKSTKDLVNLVARILPPFSLTLGLPVVRNFVRSADALYLAGLVENGEVSP
ncbi:MAG: TetR/AcrR family transcriptional regulator [Bryobacterales bacterium]|nr:TetR/AcrR family transcriptional regulator [Bryobacterales bacterium]